MSLGNLPTFQPVAPDDWTTEKSKAYLRCYEPGHTKPKEPTISERGRAVHEPILTDFLSGVEDTCRRLRQKQKAALALHSDAEVPAALVGWTTDDDTDGGNISRQASYTARDVAKSTTALPPPTPPTLATMPWDSMRGRTMLIRPRLRSPLEEHDSDSEDSTAETDSSAGYDAPDDTPELVLPDNTALVQQVEIASAEAMVQIRTLAAVERFWYCFAMLRSKPESRDRDAINKVFCAIYDVHTKLTASKRELESYFNDRVLTERAARKYRDSVSARDLCATIDKAGWRRVHNTWRKLIKSVVQVQSLVSCNLQLALDAGKTDTLTASGMFM